MLILGCPSGAMVDTNIWRKRATCCTVPEVPLPILNRCCVDRTEHLHVPKLGVFPPRFTPHALPFPMQHTCRSPYEWLPYDDATSRVHFLVPAVHGPFAAVCHRSRFVFRFPYRVIFIVIFSPVVNTPADIRRKPEEGASSVLHWWERIIKSSHRTHRIISRVAV